MIKPLGDTMTLVLVMAVPLLVWLGTFGYLLFVDRSLRQLERGETGEDDL